MLPAQDQHKIIWIASYPKSGNTWVRFTLANLLYGQQESAAVLRRLLPDIHELTVVPNTPPPRLVLMKTHFPFSPQMPLAPCTRAFIYIVRNPMDAMISAFHMVIRKLGDMPESELAAAKQEFIDEFIAHQGHPIWIKKGWGSWVEHVCSWSQAAKAIPGLVLRYEDMLKDPVGAATALNGFLQLGKSGEEIEQAVKHSSFEQMQQVEESDIRAKRVGLFYGGPIEQGIASGRRFMRQGRAGKGADELSEEQRRRFMDVFGSVMEELGYVTAPRSESGIDVKPT